MWRCRCPLRLLSPDGLRLSVRARRHYTPSVNSPLDAELELETGAELIDREAGIADEASQRSLGNFTVIRHRQAGDVAWLHEDDVAATLARDLPSQPLEGLHGFPPRDDGK